MAERKQYYDILNVSKQSSETEIKRAYRDLARRFHPDKAVMEGLTVEAAQERFVEISEAYEVHPESFIWGNNPSHVHLPLFHIKSVSIILSLLACRRRDFSEALEPVWEAPRSRYQAACSQECTATSKRPQS